MVTSNPLSKYITDQCKGKQVPCLFRGMTLDVTQRSVLRLPRPRLAPAVAKCLLPEARTILIGIAQSLRQDDIVTGSIDTLNHVLTLTWSD